MKQALYPLTNEILRELDNKIVLLYKLYVWYLVVKPACITHTINY